MLISRRTLTTFGLLAASLSFVVACDDGDPDIEPSPDGPAGCDPLSALPANFRPIPKVSAGMVSLTVSGDGVAGIVDATAGGPMSSADNPYIYLDLKAGTKVEINDLDARSSMTWDVALKRASLRINGGDSGTGGRKLAVVQAADLTAVSAPPSSGYAVDDFADADCALISLPAGEPMSAFGEWYDYNPDTHVVTPKSEVYVLERADGSHTALRLLTYYGDTANPMRGGYYRVEWKPL
ncbi:MAG TPA: HmuY family protein [Kofleriaceae bacterium]|nr:HmuY family protein [Kofleriaceae bacterium]